MLIWLFNHKQTFAEVTVSGVAEDNEACAD